LAKRDFLLLPNPPFRFSVILSKQLSLAQRVASCSFRGHPRNAFAGARGNVLLCDFDKLNIPNAFTPNDDGVNDVFRVVPVENLAEVYSLTVFNRWGQKVWEGAGINAQWDGKIDGKPAVSDVYVWLLKGGCGGEQRQKQGDVGLLR
jgi:gliding motility-associated-like protein